VQKKPANQPVQVQKVDALKQYLKKVGAIGYIDFRLVEPDKNVLLTIPAENS
jgi:hypothetical protein